MTIRNTISRWVAPALLALTAFATQAAPYVSLGYSPNTIPGSGTSQMMLYISDDAGLAYTGGAATITYAAGVLNAPSPVYYNDCSGTVTATPGTNSMSFSGVNVGAFGGCYIYITVTAPSAGTYTTTIPAGAFTTSIGSNPGAASATLTVIAPILVTNTNDSGAGSLRDAIGAANGACASGLAIHFAIPGPGPHTIAPASDLPGVTCPGLYIDGYSQPGAVKNTDVGASNNAVIRIALVGPGSGTGLLAIGSSVHVFGLALHGWNIALKGTVYAYGNYLGTDPGGMSGLPNNHGVWVDSGYAAVGSFDAEFRNLITNSIVGGSTSYGVYAGQTGRIEVINNLIGGRRDGSAGLVNGVGVMFSDATGGRSYVENNIIRYNAAQGVILSAGTTSPVLTQFNSIYGNGSIGIDLGGDGATPNDESGPPYDTDTGPNRLMNYPVITSVQHSGGTTIVSGYVKSSANADADIELFHNTSPSALTEGEKLIDYFPLTLDGTGYAEFTRTIGFLFDNVSAQATFDTCGDGCVYSSEFSPKVAATAAAECYIGVNVPATGDGGRAVSIPGGSVLVAPSTAATIFAHCNPPNAPTAWLWGGGETVPFLDITTPAAGTSATYTVTMQTPLGPQTVTVTLDASPPGAPVCSIMPTIQMPLHPLNTSPFTVPSTCSPAATGFSWLASVGPLQFVSGQGTDTATYQMVGAAPGYGWFASMTPSNASGTGAEATRIIWVGPVDVVETSLAFPATAVGSQSAPLTVTIRNLSDYFQPSLNVIASGPYVVVANNCPMPVPALTDCTIDIAFAPTAPGKGLAGALTVSFSFPGNPSYTVALSGEGVAAPGVTITPASLTFAPRTVASTSTPQTVTIANSGSAPLTLTSIGISGDFGFATVCPGTLAPGETCTIDVTFTPLVEGARNGFLTVTHDAPGSPFVVGLNGTGVSALSPVADVAPGSLDFAPQSVGTESAVQFVTVTNSGTAPLTFSSISISGEYSIASPGTGADPPECPLTLAPGESCQIGVVFRPAGFNLREGALAIATNAGTVTVRLIGTGLVLAAPQLSVPATLAFAGQPIGTRSAGRALAIANTSINLATITELSATGDFSVSDTCTTIAAGATCSPLVFFQPTALGPRVGTLTIRTLRDANPYTVSLSGNGEANLLPVMEVSVTRLGFGNAFIGMPVTLAVTLRNIGQAPLAVSALRISGDFFADMGCVTTIAPSASCTVHVTFLPGAPGGQAGTMEIDSNAAGTPHRVDLGGTGCFLPSPSRARFGILLCGS